jgi:hypothetical protein
MIEVLATKRKVLILNQTFKNIKTGSLMLAQLIKAG